MSRAGAQAAALPAAAPWCWPSAWASIGLIWLISSCALRKSSNGSHWVLTTIWFSLVHGAAAAARRLGDNAVQVREGDPLAEQGHPMVNTVHCQDHGSGA